MKKKVLISVIAVISSILVVIGVKLIYESYAEYTKNKQSLRQTESEEFAKQTELNVTFISLESSWNMAMAEFIQDFEDLHPDIDIQYNIYSETGLYEDTINKLYARGQLGDVVEMIDPTVYAENDVLFPIPDSLSEQTSCVSSYKETVYGIGTVGYTTGIIYNKRIFEKFGLEEPNTYKEFLDICQTLAEHGVTPLVAGGANQWHMSFLTDHFFRTNVLNENENWLEELKTGESSWDDSQMCFMLKEMTMLFRSGYVDALWETIPDSSVAALMADESVAMAYSGSWLLNDIQNISENVDIGWFYLPDYEGRIIVEKQVGGYWTLTKECGADSEKLAAATAFLEYFYAKGVYEDMCSAVTGMSLLERSSTSAYSELQQEVWVGYEDSDAGYTENLLSSAVPQEFRKYLYQTIEDTLKGEYEPEEAAVLLQEKWQSIKEGQTDED